MAQWLRALCCSYRGSSAEVLGRKEGIRLYQFLEGPLTEYFGKEWYDELKLACEAYLDEYGG